MSESGVSAHGTAEGLESRAEIRREFDRSVAGSTAVAMTVTEAIDRWPELSDRPVFGEGVALSQLDGLFERSPAGSDPPHPTVEFQFQHCKVVVCYGYTLGVSISRRR